MTSIFTKPISVPRPGRPRPRRPKLRRPTVSRPTLGGPTLTLPRLRRSQPDGVNVVGVEIEAGSVAAVEATLQGGVPQVTVAGIQPLTANAFRDGEVAEPDAVTAAVRTLFETQGLSRRVRLGIANQRLVVRTLRLPAIENPDELDSAVRFSAQEQLAMPLEDAIIEHRVVGGVAGTSEGPPQIDVMVVAARREMILASLAPLREAGLEPVGVDLSAFGMIRALADAPSVAAEEPAAGAAAERAGVLYCNVGDATNLAVAAGRSCLFTRVSPAGLGDMVESLAAATGLSLEDSAHWLSHVGLGRPLDEIEGDPAVVSRARQGLEHGAASLVDELRLSLDFYAAQEAAVPVERIVLSGPGSAIPGLPQEMESSAGLPITVGRPAALGSYDTVAAARLTLPLGLALDL